MTQDQNRQDAVLVRRVLAGDHDAWNELTRRYMPMVYALAWRSTRNAQDAQDLTQDTLVQAYTQLASLRRPERFGPWLHQIGRNFAHRLGRRPLHLALDSQGHTTAEDEMAAAPVLPDPLVVQASTGLERLAAQTIVHRALERLPEKLRRTIHLRYWEELDYRQISTALSVPQGTVKRRLHEARRKLQQEVSRMQEEAIVLRHAVGLETTGQCHTPIFVRGLHLPVRWTKMLSTGADDQRQIGLHVLQGDSLQADQCRTLCLFTIKGLAPGQRRGEPKLRMSLEITARGRLNFDIRDLSGHPLELEGTPARVHIEEEGDFSGYGGLWGDKS
ncbi:MAG: sigma-70 family RNA polymerase sigma factor [Candidatus Latescibacteria bacterium]|nr:sigma-70 family RNA polymerase sigma factor [Candidatus Latescibacterota bacterium]